MKGRILATILIAATFVGMIMLGEYVDRMWVSMFLWVIIGISVIEMRKALKERIPDSLSWLVWTFAIGFGPSYFFAGFVGSILFTLAVFIVGAITIFVRNLELEALQSFALVLVYPAMLLSCLMYINRSASTNVITQESNPVLYNYVLTHTSYNGEQLLPYNTVGMALVLAVSCFSDVFALVVGKIFGKTKLCPTLSPNKTVEGAIGGLFGGLLGAGLCYVLFEVLNIFTSGLPSDLHLAYRIIDYVLIGLVGSAFTQAGDLFASYVKRHCGLKDFSHLLGGHGGFVDRFDGIMFNGVFVAIIWAFIL